MRVLILGGKRFIGRHTAEVLAAAGHEVTVLNRGGSPDELPEHVERLRGDRCAVLRPQIVVGPHDPDERLAYWIGRAQHGGSMLAPGDGTDVLQVIDVRDVACFVRTVVERQLGGAFNLAGPRMSWAAFLAALGATDPVWVPASVVEAAGVTFLELPIYRRRDGPRGSLMDVSNEKACRAGLRLTEPARTIGDTRAWMQGRPWRPLLDPAREAALIAAARHWQSASGSLRVNEGSDP